MHIILTGTESTFKSSLAEKLSQEYGLSHASEYARGYIEKLGPNVDLENFPKEHFFAIAKGQFALEHSFNYHDPQAPTCVFDTDHITLDIWNRAVWGEQHPAFRTVFPHNIYLLCAPTTPWVDDGMRVDGHRREELHQMYVELLDRSGALYVTLESPDFDGRLEEAKKVMKGLEIEIKLRDSADH